MPQQKDTPAIEGQAYTEMKSRWPLIRMLMGDTDSMRANAPRWLPQWPKEDPDRYIYRVSTSFLFPGFHRTVTTLTSKVFKEPVVLNDDVPEAIKVYTPNIDMMGKDLNTFCEAWFQDGLEVGISYGFVDYTGTIEGKTSQALKSDSRPVWVHIRAENLFFYATEIVDDVKALSEIRFYEYITVKDGEFGEKEIKQIRQVKLVDVTDSSKASKAQGATPSKRMTYQVWRRDEKDKDKNKWRALTEPKMTSLDEIPLAVFYGDETDGFMRAAPPMINLAFTNLALAQSESTQGHCLDLGRRPWPFFSGMPPGDLETVNVGPHSGISASDPNADAKIIEPSGIAIDAGRQHGLDLKADMAVQGNQLLVRTSVEKTAEESANEKQETDSELARMAVSFENAVNEALRFTAKWLKLEGGGTARLNKRFGVLSYQAHEIAALTQAWTLKGISWELYMACFLWRGMIPPNWDMKEEKIRVDAQSDDFEDGE